MKRFLCLALVVCMLCVCFGATVSAQDKLEDAWDIMVMVNGRRVIQDSNGVSLVIKTAWKDQGAVNLAPVRAICEALGANINWNNETKTVTIYNDTAAIALQVDNDLITIGRKTEAGDYNDTVSEQILAAPVNVNGTVYIPIRAVAEGLGATVEWIADQKLITINNQTEENTEAEIQI